MNFLLELTAQQNEGHRQYGADFVHVPGWMDGWVGGWMGGSKSHFKDCLQQSKICPGGLGMFLRLLNSFKLNYTS
jgi:hypothetical protein